MNKNKIFAISILGVLGFGLGACETVPYEERAAAFEAKINAQFLNKSVDELILAYGPPNSKYPLSDGRDVIQYGFDRTETRGGDTYTDYQSVFAGYRYEKTKDGKQKQVPIYNSVPYLRTNPVYTVNLKCYKRFIIGKTKMVEGFKWEGNSCFK